MSPKNLKPQETGKSNKLKINVSIMKLNKTKHEADIKCITFSGKHSLTHGDFEISVSQVHHSSCERHHNAFIYPFVKVCNMAYTSCITRIISDMTSLFKFYNQISSNKRNTSYNKTNGLKKIINTVTINVRRNSW